MLKVLKKFLLRPIRKISHIKGNKYYSIAVEMEELSRNNWSDKYGINV